MTTPTEPILPARVMLPPALVARLPQPAWAERLREGWQQLLSHYGVPGRAEVTLVGGEGPRPVWVTIGEVACPYPGEVLEQAQAWVMGGSAGGDLAEVGSEDSAEILHLACLAILQRQPARWLIPDTTAHYQARLLNLLEPADLPAPEALQRLLAFLLNWHIPIGDVAAVAQTLRAHPPAETDAVTLREALFQQLRPHPLAIEVNLDTLRALTFDANAGDKPFALLRDALFYELGLRLPDVRWLPTPDLPDGAFRFRLNALTTLPYTGIPPGHIFVNATPDQLPDLPAQPARHPAGLYPGAFLPESYRLLVTAQGLTAYTPLGYLILALNQQVRALAGSWLDQTVCQRDWDKLRANYPTLIDAALQRWTPALITHTARLLLAEGLSIRNWRHILQALLDFDVIVTDPVQLIVLDPRLPLAAAEALPQAASAVNLAAYTRTSLKTYITHKLSGGTSTLNVHLLETELEQMLVNQAGLDWETHLARVEATLGDAFRAAVRETLDDPTPPLPAILTSVDVRPVVRDLLAAEWPDLPIISYNDLDPAANLYTLSRIALSAR